MELWLWAILIIFSPFIIYVVGKMLSAGIMDGYYQIRKKYEKGDTHEKH